MTAREILLKHVNEGTSERVKKLNEIVDWSMFIAAMEEYAEQQVKLLVTPAVSNNEVAVCEKKNCTEPVYEFGLCFKHYCISEEH